MSHGDHADHLAAYHAVRAASDEAGRSVGVLVDLQGPKIRLGRFPAGAVMLSAGKEFGITSEDIPGIAAEASTTYQGLAGDVRPWDQILVDDGRVVLEVSGVHGDRVRTRVLVGGMVSDHKGLNIPGAALAVPALSRKDEQDLRWALSLRADLIALSFVRCPQDADPVRAIMDEAGARLPVIAKIEKPQAVDALPEVLEAFDGLMVGARRPGRGAATRAGADGAKTRDRPGEGQGQAGHRRYPDAGVDDLGAATDQGGSF